jgi:hypothetical protein
MTRHGTGAPAAGRRAITMKRNPSLFTSRPGSVMIGSMMLAMLATGCGESEPAAGTKAASPAPASPSPTVKKPGRREVDTTSRQELQKQRAAEQAKSGQ